MSKKGDRLLFYIALSLFLFRQKSNQKTSSLRQIARTLSALLPPHAASKDAAETICLFIFAVAKTIPIKYSLPLQHI